jgi:hypothetical protein
VWGIEQVTALLREDHTALAAAEIDGLDEPLGAEMAERVVVDVEVLFGHDAKIVHQSVAHVVVGSVTPPTPAPSAPSAAFAPVSIGSNATSHCGRRCNRVRAAARARRSSYLEAPWLIGSIGHGYEAAVFF